ncbi:MAG: 50S ribosomal protein L28 [Candidatus Kapabacteria bacterium]|nr:50S ribosomal protein L28 [Candidatus Kapabacteria bacterium]MCS7169417.1 50S ribosomal protein L28 [Candidatus Kapabacteria bacterium]MDW7996751.1 50S ribosomal protein L28 [Bacteroidota bacterium]MDW8225136.1 50S ribosomal protein L28 [Bacteroidota bacterium]
MPKRCQLTGIGPQSGHKVSHANNRSNRKFLPNLQWKRVWVPELQRWVRLRLTVKALKTLDHKGFHAMVAELRERKAHELLHTIRRRLADT